MVRAFSDAEEHIMDKILEMVEGEGSVEYVQEPTHSIASRIVSSTRLTV